ncbi:MAG: rod shape-determining protein MreC [Candidatus Neomarinimicrobiota bacterium]
MRNLYFFLTKQKDHLIFILALGLSLSLLSNHDSPDLNLLRGKSIDILGHIISPVTWINSMLKLEEETQLLREKNIQITLEMESLIRAGEENQRLRELLNFKNESNLVLLPARVLNSGVSSNLTALTLDVGTTSGIKINQPVITPDGVVGKTILVGENTAVVQMLSDVNFRLSVRIMPSGTVGILRWKNNNICQIWELQKNAPINVDDQVVTSGFSHIYPRNLPVGRVIGVLEERGSFQKIAQVRIKPELSSLMNLFVVIEENNELD